MIAATGPMACHDGNGLLTSLVESDPEWLWALVHAPCVTSTLLLTSVELGGNELGWGRLGLFKLCLVTGAHLHKLLHWAIARVAASKVRATINVALDNSLHLRSHLGTLWQWATFMTVHVMSALPVAFDDLQSFVALLPIHHRVMLVVSMMFVVAVRQSMAVPVMAHTC